MNKTWEANSDESLREVINKAKDGDLILLAPGTYKVLEPEYQKKNIRIKANNKVVFTGDRKETTSGSGI